MRRPIRQTKRGYPKNLGKGVPFIPQEPPHAQGPFSARQNGQGIWFVDDAHGRVLLRVRGDFNSRRDAEWIAKTLSAAHYVEETAARNQEALLKSEKRGAAK